MGPVNDPDDRSGELAVDPSAGSVSSPAAVTRAWSLISSSVLSSLARQVDLVSPTLKHIETVNHAARELITPPRAALDLMAAEAARPAAVLAQAFGQEQRELQRGLLRQVLPAIQAVPAIRVPALRVWPVSPIHSVVPPPAVLDLARPQLPDFSRLLASVAAGAAMDMNVWARHQTEFWAGLRRFGQRVAFWAVTSAQEAMSRGNMDALAKFVGDWLDQKPTPARVEALVEALLQFDHTRYAEDDGQRMLADLKQLVAVLATRCGRQNQLLLGTRHRAGSILTIPNPDELPMAGWLGKSWERGVEDRVLEQMQPDGDPRVKELINNLPARDRAIVMTRLAATCSWPAAAEACGARRERGEIVSQRLKRQRARLAPDDDPWSATAGLSPRERAAYGRLRPGGIVIYGHAGIVP